MSWNTASFMGWLYWVYWIVAIIIMVRVMLKNRDTVKTLAWIMVFVFLPFLGLVLYFFFGRDTRRKRVLGTRMLSQIKQRSQLEGKGMGKACIEGEYQALATFLENSSSASLLSADGIEVITETSRFSDALFDIVSSAKEHIHLQFYIFEDDEFGRRLRDLLVAKAKQGVEVRLIYDSVGCWKVSKEFFESMRCSGVYVECFLKVRFPILSNRFNYRNHRKVVVVDGRVGMVGGCNIADRYLKGIRGGAWRDTMLLLKGAAVYGLQASFLIDWCMASRTLLSGKRYFPSTEYNAGPLVQVATSNPVGDIRPIEGALMKALATAKGYAYLQTPYFMPDESFLRSLKNASVSGVDVRLMIPEYSDSWIADYGARAYLGDLLNAGVKVYLYGKGMLHSKTMVCDDYFSSVGSTNLDFRSFFYNFEINAFVYDKSVALKLKDTFMEDVKGCRLLTLNEYRSRSFSRRCLESFVKLFSPLL